jgi:hypothetical protein
VPKGFRDMKRELENRSQSTNFEPISTMSHQEIRDESYNLAVIRNTRPRTPEENKRADELWEESTSRTYEGVYGHRPTQKAPQQPTETERRAERVVDFVNIINPQYKKYGVIVPREKQEV